MAHDLLDTAEEIDLTNDTAVERITAVFTVVSVEQKESQTENGSGKYEAITVESDDLPFPITLRYFTEYESATGKDSNWVKQQRGMLKNLAKAIFGEPRWNRSLAEGKSFTATTKDDGQGRATLTGFRKS